MPSSPDILLGLARIAVGARAVSIGWHVVLAVTTAALIAGWRPHKRHAAAALGAPLASVAVLAFSSGNPFNGAVFSLLAGALAVLASSAPRGCVERRAGWSAGLGSILIVFGAVYPHFLGDASWLTYVYAAPLGTIPCPTLSVVIGVALVAGGFGLGWWRLTLGLAGCFYGLFGVVRLGVTIDAVLLCGALALLVQYAIDRPLSRASQAGFGRVRSRNGASPAGPGRVLASSQNQAQSDGL